MSLPPPAAGAGRTPVWSGRRRAPGRASIRANGPASDPPLLPDSLTHLSRLGFLTYDERRFMSHVQGRTYTGVLSIVERFVATIREELAAMRALGGPQALGRFEGKESGPGGIFSTLGSHLENGLPPGYEFGLNPDRGVRAMLANSGWAVLALLCHFDLFAQSHHLRSMDPGEEFSPVLREAIRRHGQRQSMHATADQAAWLIENAGLERAEREAAIHEYIGLLRLLDALLFRQARSDAAYFLRNCGRVLPPAATSRFVRDTFVAYRCQHIVWGEGDVRFRELLSRMVTPGQVARVEAAIAHIGVADIR